MIYRTDIDHLILDQAFTTISVPLEICAMILLFVVFVVAVRYRVYTDFPGNLFLWVLVLDLCHAVFTPIRWIRASPTAYNHLGNPDTMSPGICSFYAFIDTFFHMGSLFTNTAIIGSVFYMVFFTSDFRSHRRAKNLFVVGFWVFTLALSLPTFSVTPYRGVGWCVSDSMPLAMKQITWATCIVLQVAMVIPTNWKIYQSSLVNVKGVSKGTYFRFCGIVIIQIIGLFPTLIVEFNGMVRQSSSAGILYLVVIGLPLGHLLDALLMSVKVLPYMFPFLHSLFSRFDSSKNNNERRPTTTSAEDDTKERIRRSAHKGNSKHNDKGVRHGQSDNNIDGLPSKASHGTKHKGESKQDKTFSRGENVSGRESDKGELKQDKTFSRGEKPGRESDMVELQTALAVSSKRAAERNADSSSSSHQIPAVGPGKEKECATVTNIRTVAVPDESPVKANPGRSSPKITSAQIHRLRGHHTARCGVITQVFWVLVFPLILLLVVCAVRASGSYADHKTSEASVANLQLARPVASLVHFLEDECASTVIYMNSNFSQFLLTIAVNHQDTNQAIHSFNSMIQSVPQELRNLDATIAVVQALESVPQLRTNITQSQTTVADAIQAYSTITSLLVAMLTAAAQKQRADTISSKLVSFSMSLCLHTMVSEQYSRAIAIKTAYNNDPQLSRHTNELQIYLKKLGNSESALKFYTVLTPDTSALEALVQNYSSSSTTDRYKFFSHFNDEWLTDSIATEIESISRFSDGMYQLEVNNYNELVSTSLSKAALVASELRYGVVGMAFIASYFCVALFIMVYGIDTILRDVRALEVKHETRAGKRFIPESKKQKWQAIFSFKARLIISLFIPMAVSFTILMDLIKGIVDSTQSTARMVDNLTFGLVILQFINAVSQEQAALFLYAAEGMNPNMTANVHARMAATDAIFQGHSKYLYEQFDDPLILSSTPFAALLASMKALPAQRKSFFNDTYVNVPQAGLTYVPLLDLYVTILIWIPLIAPDGLMDQYLIGFLSVVFVQFGFSSQRLEGYDFRVSDMQSLDSYAKYCYTTGMFNSYAFVARVLPPPTLKALYSSYESSPIHANLIATQAYMALNNTAAIEKNIFPEEWYDLYTTDIEASSIMADTFGNAMTQVASTQATTLKTQGDWFLGGFGLSFFLAGLLVCTAQRKLRKYSSLMARLLTYEDNRMQVYLKDEEAANQRDGGVAVSAVQQEMKSKSSQSPHRSYSLPSLGLGGPGPAHDPALSLLSEIISGAHNVLPEIAHFYQWIARTDCQQRGKELHELLVSTSAVRAQVQVQPQFWPELLALAAEAKLVKNIADPSERTARTVTLIARAEGFYAKFGLQQLKVSVGKPYHSPSQSPRRSSTFAGRSSSSTQAARQHTSRPNVALRVTDSAAPHH